MSMVTLTFNYHIVISGNNNNDNNYHTNEVKINAKGLGLYRFADNILPEDWNFRIKESLSKKYPCRVIKYQSINIYNVIELNPQLLVDDLNLYPYSNYTYDFRYIEDIPQYHPFQYHPKYYYRNTSVRRVYRPKIHP